MARNMVSKQERWLPGRGEEPDIGVRQAGKLGGLSTRSRHGTDHFKAAGRKGQAVFASRYTTDDRRRWGALGGRPARIRYPGHQHHGGDREIQ
jgi:hypothetical protein